MRKKTIKIIKYILIYIFILISLIYLLIISIFPIIDTIDLIKFHYGENISLNGIIHFNQLEGRDCSEDQRMLVQESLQNITHSKIRRCIYMSFGYIIADFDIYMVASLEELDNAKKFKESNSNSSHYIFGGELYNDIVLLRKKGKEYPEIIYFDYKTIP